MAHGQWTEVEARGVLEAWKRSGQTLEGYARSRGLVPQRLHWWKAKLGFGKALETKARPVALLPVHVAEGPRRRPSRRSVLRREPLPAVRGVRRAAVLGRVAVSG
jgi:hypothetical protein